jgi:hypothetical protein
MSLIQDNQRKAAQAPTTPAPMPKPAKPVAANATNVDYAATGLVPEFEQGQGQLQLEQGLQATPEQPQEPEQPEQLPMSAEAIDAQNLTLANITSYMTPSERPALPEQSTPVAPPVSLWKDASVDLGATNLFSAPIVATQSPTIYSPKFDEYGNAVTQAAYNNLDIAGRYTINQQNRQRQAAAAAAVQSYVSTRGNTPNVPDVDKPWHEQAINGVLGFASDFLQGTKESNEASNRGEFNPLNGSYGYQGAGLGGAFKYALSVPIGLGQIVWSESDRLGIEAANAIKDKLNPTVVYKGKKVQWNSLTRQQKLEEGVAAVNNKPISRFLNIPELDSRTANRGLFGKLADSLTGQVIADDIDNANPNLPGVVVSENGQNFKAEARDRPSYYRSRTRRPGQKLQDDPSTLAWSLFNQIASPGNKVDVVGNIIGDAVGAVAAPVVKRVFGEANKLNQALQPVAEEAAKVDPNFGMGTVPYNARYLPKQKPAPVSTPTPVQVLPLNARPFEAEVMAGGTFKPSPTPTKAVAPGFTPEQLANTPLPANPGKLAREATVRAPEFTAEQLAANPQPVPFVVPALVPGVDNVAPTTTKVLPLTTPAAIVSQVGIGTPGRVIDFEAGASIRNHDDMVTFLKTGTPEQQKAIALYSGSTWEELQKHLNITTENRGQFEAVGSLSNERLIQDRHVAERVYVDKAIADNALVPKDSSVADASLVPRDSTRADSDEALNYALSEPGKPVRDTSVADNELVPKDTTRADADEDLAYKLSEPNRKPQDASVAEQARAPQDKAVADAALTPRDRAIADNALVPQDSSIADASLQFKDKAIADSLFVPRDTFVADASLVPTDKFVADVRPPGELAKLFEDSIFEPPTYVPRGVPTYDDLIAQSTALASQRAVIDNSLEALERLFDSTLDLGRRTIDELPVTRATADSVTRSLDVGAKLPEQVASILPPNLAQAVVENNTDVLAKARVDGQIDVNAIAAKINEQLDFTTTKVNRTIVPPNLAPNLPTTVFHGTSLKNWTQTYNLRASGSRGELGSGLYTTVDKMEASYYSRATVGENRSASIAYDELEPRVVELNTSKLQTPLDARAPIKAGLVNAIAQETGFSVEQLVKAGRLTPGTKPSYVDLVAAVERVAASKNSSEQNLQLVNRQVSEALRKQGYDSVFDSKSGWLMLTDNVKLGQTRRSISKRTPGAKEAATSRYNADTLAASKYPDHLTTDANLRDSAYKILDQVRSEVDDKLAEVQQQAIERIANEAPQPVLNKVAVDVASVSSTGKAADTAVQLKQMGVSLEPLLLKANPDGSYSVVGNYHVLEAATLNEAAKVNAMVVEGSGKIKRGHINVELAKVNGAKPVSTVLVPTTQAEVVAMVKGNRAQSVIPLLKQQSPTLYTPVNKDWVVEGFIEAKAKKMKAYVLDDAGKAKYVNVDVENVKGKHTHWVRPEKPKPTAAQPAPAPASAPDVATRRFANDVENAKLQQVTKEVPVNPSASVRELVEDTSNDICNF